MIPPPQDSLSCSSSHEASNGNNSALPSDDTDDKKHRKAPLHTFCIHHLQEDDEHDDYRTHHDPTKRLHQQRIKMVQSTWLAIRFGLDSKACEIFYHRLFSEFPCVREMFPTDMKGQYQKLFQALCLVVKALTDNDKDDNNDTWQSIAVPTLQDLGKRHARAYGVQAAHYEAVTECFLWTLQTYVTSKIAAAASSPYMLELLDAWEYALSKIGRIMAQAGEEVLEEQRRQKHQPELLSLS